MKKLPIYQVDAFASTLFSGNPAAVCPLTEWLSDALMQSIATENNLSETAFIVPEEQGYGIRWFTPNGEVALCGHATLASAFVVLEILRDRSDNIVFHSLSGDLTVTRDAITSVFKMNFPALPYTPYTASDNLLAMIGCTPLHVYESTYDLLCILASDHDVQAAKPDLSAMTQLHHRGLILSARGETSDVYSRCFYPGCDVPEDPVTGSAHCVIAPYWCAELGKSRLHARQGSKRIGELQCEVVGDRVILSGECRLYLDGHIYIDPVLK